MTNDPTRDSPLASEIAALDERNAVRILQAVARSNLASAAPQPVWEPDLGQALCTQFGVSSATSPAAPGDLARHALLLMADDPAYAQPISLLIKGPSSERFDLGTVTGPFLIIASLFALQSTIHIARDKQGRWTFEFTKKPTNDSVITPLIRKLVELISGGPPRVS